MKQIFLVLIFTIITISVYSQGVIFEDQFNTASSLTNNWVLCGSPKPVWVSSVLGRSGIFDNMGDSWYGSSGYSKALVGSPCGYVLESETYLHVTNLAGCWAELGIGLTKTTNPPDPGNGGDVQWGIGFHLNFYGDACWGAPTQYRRHSYLIYYIYAEDGTYDGNCEFCLNADSYANGWHAMKVVIQSDRYVKFYMDNNLIWTSTKKLHPSMMTKRNVGLGIRSSGNAGKTYHDWVKVSLPNDLVVVDRNVGNNRDIFIAGVDGTNMTNITNHAAEDFHPRVNKKNDKVLFISNRTGQANVFVMNINGSNVQQVTTNGVSGGQYNVWYRAFADFTCDNKIVYSKGNQLRRINIDGTNDILIATAPSDNWERIACSPTGNKIAALTMGGWSYNEKIYIMNPDGSNMSVLVPDNPGGIYLGGFSPDGSKLAYIYDVSGHEAGIGNQINNHVFLIDIDGSNNTDISGGKPANTNDYYPAVSADGQKVIFSHGPNTGGSDVWSMNIDGSNRQMIISNGYVVDASSCIQCGSNQPPVALCNNVTVSAGVSCNAYTLINNGSYDPDGDPITLTQSPAGPYALGTTSVTLTVTDDKNASSTCTATVTVVDDTPPSIMCSDNITTNTDAGSCSAIVNYTVTASDNCSTPTVTCSPPSGSSFAKGTTTVNCSATDGANNSSTCSFTVTVNDNQTPSITVASPVTLWPPNHQYETITMDQLVSSVSDNCGGVTISDIVINKASSDEPENANGNGDGNTLNDIVIANDCKSIELRKERDGNGNGRVYTIHLRLQDADGNTTSALAYVKVPHNQGNNAIDDGAASGYTVNSSCYIPKANEPTQNRNITSGYSLHQNFPNPFSATNHASTEIGYRLPAREHVVITVRNMLGEEVGTLVDAHQDAGSYSTQWNGKNHSGFEVPSGMYIYQLRAGDVLLVKKLMLIR